MAGITVTDVPFVKMHGAGNDYVFVDGFESSLPDNPPELARQVSDRHFGIGSDGLVFLIPPADNSTDVQMRMWNADGSEGAMCGNALRCIALWMHHTKRTSDACRIDTASGTVLAKVLSIESCRHAAEVRVTLAEPVLSTGAEQVLEGIGLPGREEDSIRFTPVSIGNPHVVIFVDELTDQRVRQLGSLISTHARFPDGVNVEWVRVTSRQRLEVRVWERGSGETLACGSGACAAVAAAIDRDFCGHNELVQVVLPGGTLTVKWNLPSEDGCGQVLLTGPAKISFQGIWPV